MYLQPTDIEKIESAANELIVKAYEDSKITLPIDINKIAETEGISIRDGDFGNDEISGAFDRAGKVIYVSRTESYRRKAFTIAHEIGHYVLHKEMPNEVFLRSDASRISDPENDRQEAEANWFAASLLMPRDHVDKYAPYTKSLDTLATMFGVSRPAMFYRLKSLGYTGFSLEG